MDDFQPYETYCWFCLTSQDLCTRINDLSCFHKQCILFSSIFFSHIQVLVNSANESSSWMYFLMCFIFYFWLLQAVFITCANTLSLKPPVWLCFFSQYWRIFCIFPIPPHIIPSTNSNDPLWRICALKAFGKCFEVELTILIFFHKNTFSIYL